MFRDDDKNEKVVPQSMETKKDFAPLVKAYAFFREKSNEYDVNKRTLIRHLNSHLKNNISILDFGGGDGELLYDIYLNTNLRKLNPKLYLIELVEEYQKKAKDRFATLSASFEIYKSLEECPDKSINTILVNHALYYVKNLEYVLITLLKKLSEDGQMFIVLANESNSLIKLWEKFFNKMKIQIPYFLTKDLRLIAKNKNLDCIEHNRINSIFEYKNTEENRKLMSQFLLGEHANKIADESIQEVLAEYQSGTDIKLPLEDSLFVIKK